MNQVLILLEKRPGFLVQGPRGPLTPTLSPSAAADSGKTGTAGEKEQAFRRIGWLGESTWFPR